MISQLSLYLDICRFLTCSGSKPALIQKKKGQNNNFDPSDEFIESEYE
jgi:hypothetical protein